MFGKLSGLIKAGAMPSKKTIMVLGAVLLVAITVFVMMNTTEVVPYEPFAGSGAGETLYLVYADWCPHCKSILPMAKEMEAKSPVTVAGRPIAIKLLESDANKAEIAALGTKVEGYPTFLFRNKAGKMLTYEGERTQDAIMEFIKKN